MTRIAKPRPRLLAALLFSHALVLAFSHSASADDGRDRLVGTYEAAPYTQPAPDGTVAYVTARFEFDGHRNAITISAFADPALSQPIFTYASEGPIDIQGPSERFEGGWNVISRNDSSLVEIFIDAPPIWEVLGLAACPLQIGTPTEISGCVDGGPLNIAGCAEFDVLWLSDDGQSFRTGGGEVNRCEDYPDALGEIDYQRVDP